MPFKLFKGGRTKIERPEDVTRVFALHERAAACEIVFPNVDGYRLEHHDGPLHVDFSTVDDYLIDGSKLPTKTFMGTALSGEEVELSPESILALRDQQIVFNIARAVLRRHFADDDGNPEFQRFHEVRAAVDQWYATRLRVLGKDQQWKKLVYYADPKKVVEHVRKGLHAGPDGQDRIRPILNHYNPTGSSRFVHGQTSRDVFPTRHSHVNFVVMDSGWEGRVAKVLDDLAEEKRIETWVKNVFLDFRIPYTDALGEQRDYYADFIVRARAPDGAALRLVVEVTGMTRDKPEKKWTVEHRWLPAVNAVAPARGWGRWLFLELAGETALADARNLIVQALECGD